MSFVNVIKLNTLLIFLSNLSANAMELDIEGSTQNFKPKFTVISLAKTDDRVCAIEGVDDLTTPLGLAGTIFYGFKSTPPEQNSIGIAATDSMGEIFNKLRSSPIYPTPILTQLAIIEAPNLNISFTLGLASNTANAKWKLSMQAMKPGNLLFFNASGLAPYGNQITFTNGTRSPIMNTIFPHESAKRFEEVAAAYYLNNDKNTVYYNKGNTLKLGEDLTLNFISPEQEGN